MAFEGPGSPPLVVGDANLLYPFHLRNLLVQLGVDAIIAPRDEPAFIIGEPVHVGHQQAPDTPAG